MTRGLSTVTPHHTTRSHATHTDTNTTQTQLLLISSYHPPPTTTLLTSLSLSASLEYWVCCHVILRKRITADKQRESAGVGSGVGALEKGAEHEREMGGLWRRERGGVVDQTKGSGMQ